MKESTKYKGEEIVSAEGENSYLDGMINGHPTGTSRPHFGGTASSVSIIETSTASRPARISKSFFFLKSIQLSVKKKIYNTNRRKETNLKPE